MFEDILTDILIELEIEYYTDIIENNELVKYEDQRIFHNMLSEVCNQQESREVSQILHNFLLLKKYIIHPI